MVEISLTHAIVIASAGGIFPALLWLRFWLKEDKSHPEPRKRIFYAFLLGMIAVPFAFISELGVNVIFLQGLDISSAVKFVFPLGLTVVLLWSFIEELLKYFAAYYGGIKWKENDEPIDVVIYLIIASLGFAALENILFITQPLIEGNIHGAFITGNLRFVGASLLHVATSGIIGIATAFSYFRTKTIRKRYLALGFTGAIVLHAAFNLFIIKSENNVLPAFFVVWGIIIAVIITLEQIKKIHLNKII